MSVQGSAKISIRFMRPTFDDLFPMPSMPLLMRKNSRPDKHKGKPGRRKKRAIAEHEYAMIGEVINQVNQLELRMDRLIANYYQKSGEHRTMEFWSDFLGGRTINLDKKVTLVFKIVDATGVQKSSKWKIAARNWQRNRNAFAHGIMGVNAQTGRTEVLYNNEHYDLESITADFRKIHTRVDNVITKCETALRKSKKNYVKDFGEFTGFL